MTDDTIRIEFEVTLDEVVDAYAPLVLTSKLYRRWDRTGTHPRQEPRVRDRLRSRALHHAVARWLWQLNAPPEAPSSSRMAEPSRGAMSSPPIEDLESYAREDSNL